jgi:hypothetical protein
VHLIAPSWPLQRWGIDIVGILTLAQGNYTFAVITVEYFTKWIEAKPLTNVPRAPINHLQLTFRVLTTRRSKARVMLFSSVVKNA